MTARWEHFPHGADVGVRGFGSTKAESFEQAALALTAVIADPAGIEPREAITVKCEAPDDFPRATQVRTSISRSVSRNPVLPAVLSAAAPSR